MGGRVGIGTENGFGKRFWKTVSGNGFGDWFRKRGSFRGQPGRGMVGEGGQAGRREAERGETIRGESRETTGSCTIGYCSRPAGWRKGVEVTGEVTRGNVQLLLSCLVGAAQSGTSARSRMEQQGG